MTDIEMHAGDTGPGPRVQLLDGDGNPQSIVGATSVTLEVKGDATSEECDIVDAATGIVRVPRDVDLAVSGDRSAQQFIVVFRVVFADGDDTHFPTQANQKLKLYADFVPDP